MGKTPESVGGLQVLFGQDATAVGMSMSEVVDTYETTYQAAKGAQSPLDELRVCCVPMSAGWWPSSWVCCWCCAMS